jgi:hypothetical protein
MGNCRRLGIITRQSTDVLAINDREISQAVRFIREHASDRIGVSDVLEAVPLSRRILETRPDVLKAFTRGAPEAFRKMLLEPQPSGLWSLIKDFLWNPDFRHGLAALNTMLEAFGRSLASGDAKSQDSATPR